jgi:hypothetical protein
MQLKNVEPHRSGELDSISRLMGQLADEFSWGLCERETENDPTSELVSFLTLHNNYKLLFVFMHRMEARNVLYVTVTSCQI